VIRLDQTEIPETVYRKHLHYEQVKEFAAFFLEHVWVTVR